MSSSLFRVVLVALAAAWLLSASIFTVRETELAIKFRLREIVETDFEPGLHFMIPWINTVQKFDRRVLTRNYPAEPFLTPPGADAVLDAAAGAALLAVGLSSRWREEGLGAIRARIATESAVPVVVVGRGLRPGGLAPESTLTRFSWSLREAPAA